MDECKPLLLGRSSVVSEGGDEVGGGGVEGGDGGGEGCEGCEGGKRGGGGGAEEDVLFLSWPAPGKHVAFDGRWLHGRGLHSPTFAVQRKHFPVHTLVGVTPLVTEAAQVELKSGRVLDPAARCADRTRRHRRRRHPCRRTRRRDLLLPRRP